MEKGKGKGYLASSRQYGNALLGVRHEEETEFLHFRGMSRNSVLAADKGTKCGIFWSGSGGHRKLIAICRHDCAMKYITVTCAVTGEILRNKNIAFM